MFMIKKMLSQFLYPLPVSILFLIAGLALLLFTRKQTLGKSCCAIGLLVLLGFSYSSISAPLTSHLEYSFTPLLTSQSKTIPAQLSKIQWIAVLSHSFLSAPALPPTSQLHVVSLARTVEAIRLHRQLPHSKLLLSGGPSNQRTSHGAVMAAAAQELGVKPENIKVTERAFDTRQEALIFHTILGDQPFILVTSASHLPRAMALFQKLGMQPLASPADYDVKVVDKRALTLFDFFPNAWQLLRSTKAIHEYAGLLWAKLRGYI